jgi:hypothetical protein
LNNDSINKRIKDIGAIAQPQEMRRDQSLETGNNGQTNMRRPSPTVRVTSFWHGNAFVHGFQILAQL